MPEPRGRDSAGCLGGSPPPASVHDVLLLDLDGVVYAGPAAIPGAVLALRSATAGGARAAYVTNNASRPAAAVAAHLRELGIAAGPDDVVTSAQAGALLVSDRLPPGSKVLAVGGPGVAGALRDAGLVPVASAEAEPAAILQGYGPDVGWRDLAEAAYALAAGAFWVATNTDATIPTGRGIAPGNGAFVQVLAATTGRAPVVAGKPEPPLLQAALRRTGARRALMVGDRLDTDILGGRRCGVTTMAVLTGVTGLDGLVEAPPEQRPTLVALDLLGLLEDQPLPMPIDGGWSCRGQAATSQSGSVRLTPARLPGLERGAAASALVSPGSATRTAVQDRVRALAEVVWAARDARRDVDAEPALRQVQDEVDRLLGARAG